MLEELGHPQTIITLRADNSTTETFSNSTLKEKKSKAWDIHLYWIKYRMNNKEFHIYWYAEAEIFTDYFTKYISPTYHQAIRPTYILKNNHMNTTELHRRGVLIYQDITSWGDLDIRCHIKILPLGVILI